MKSLDFINKAKDIANNYKTLYIMGCFGSPMTETNKSRYTNNSAYNKRPERTAKINAASRDTFGFDCVCLIKGILWGWNGDLNKTYGGAVYGSNDVADVGATAMLNDHCTEISSDFSNITPGELVWMPGHIGIYIGDGLAVECTPIWKDGVQITAVKNMGTKAGYNNRTWEKHGKCEYIDYSDQNKPVEPEKPIDELKVGDKVQIIAVGNGSSYGNANAAYGLGWTRYITAIHEGRPFPYQVGNKGKTDSANTTGFYAKSALKILK